MTRESTALVLEQMGGQCLDGQCELEIGRTIGAALIVTGEVRKLEGAYLCDLKIHDTKKGSLLAVEPFRADDPLALLDRTPAAAERLVTTGIARAVGGEGTIELDVRDEGARVLLDGAEVGRGPVRKSIVTPIGMHRVVVDLEGHATWESAVSVQPRSPTVVSPRLAPLAGVSDPADRGLDKRNTYVEATGSVIQTLSHTLGPDSGYAFDLRLGRWLSRSWAGEIGFTHAAGQGTPNVPTTSSDIGNAGVVWSPVPSRWFSIAGLAGYGSTAWQVEPPTSPTRVTFTSTSWLGAAELRTDSRIGAGLAFAARVGGVVRSTQYHSGGQEILASLPPANDIDTHSKSYGYYFRAGLRYAF
jgi:hypothetical protein